MGRTADRGLFPVFLGGLLADDGGGTRGLPGDDLDVGRIAERIQKLFAVFPGQTESTYISDTQTGNYISDASRISCSKTRIHHRTLSPINKLGQRDAMVKIRADFISDFLAGDCHFVFRWPISTGYFS